MLVFLLKKNKTKQLKLAFQQHGKLLNVNLPSVDCASW